MRITNTLAPLFSLYFLKSKRTVFPELLLVSPVEVVCGRLCKLESTDVVEVQHLQHLLGVWIDLNDVLLQSGDGWDVVIATFTFLFLQFDGNSSNLRVAETSHQMCNVTEIRENSMRPRSVHNRVMRATINIACTVLTQQSCF